MLKPSLRKKTAKRNAIELEHNRLTSLINSMADAVIAVDANLKVAIYNASALNILDSNQDITGKPLGSVLKPIDKDGLAIDMADFVAKTTRPTTNRDLLLKYSDGSQINLYISVAPVHLGYGAGGDQGYVVLMRDITQEKSLEEERDEFISVVSHELRTPVAITEGEISNAEFIVKKHAKKGSDTKVLQALDEAHKQILFLADMINDLSTLSRAERGVLQIESEQINIYDFLHELKDNYHQDAAAKGLTLKAQYPAKSLKVTTSRLYLREILQNFITNAIKYTEKGSVTLSAAASGKNGVSISVADTGIGLGKSDQQKIFDKFYRVEDYHTKSVKGTGLGLYVTKKLINLLDAKVDVNSRPGHGSIFTLTIANTPDKKK